jgi:hypothetical protein
MQTYQQCKFATRTRNPCSILTRLLCVSLPLSVSASSSHHQKILGFSLPFGFSSPFGANMRSSAKQDSPSAQRNKESIWEFLSSNALPSPTGDRELRVLEIAAGCGVHTDHFAKKISTVTTKKQPYTWYPSDPSQDSIASIQCYIDDNKLSAIVKPPVPLTLDKNGVMEKETKDMLDGLDLDLIVCINMIHISPWEATLGLMSLASERLSDTGYLYCYGPYKVGDTAVESNLRFDASLKSRDPNWGVRNLEDVCSAAEEQGLQLIKKVEMPANNLSLLFQKKLP